MRIATRTFVLALAALALVAGEAQAKATAAQSCEAAKEKDAGKAAQCRLTAAAKFAGSAGGTADIEKRDAAYAKCQSKMSDAYAKADAKYGTACAVLDNATTIDALTTVYSDEVVRLNHPRYVDNGNGTVTDNSTGLVWEKKTGTAGTVVDCVNGATCPDPHDVNNTYSWSTGDNSFDGTAATVFLPTLNKAPCFGGFCDWRLPTIIELSGQDTEGIATGGIIDLTVPGCTGGSPCINPIFGPTRNWFYWSSSTNQGLPYFAGGVRFDIGAVAYDSKSSSYYVRAVRGGS